MTPNPNADAGGETPESAQAAAVNILAEFHQWREETGPCPIGITGPWANKLAHLCERLASTQQALAEARRERDEALKWEARHAMLYTEFCTLRQQNEALRRDGERIDKLERTCLFTQPHMSPSYLKGTVAIDILTRHGNLRAAIDDVLPRDNINVTYSPRPAQQAEGKP